MRHRQKETTMNCKKCGSVIDQQASSCPICGEIVEKTQEQPAQNVFFNAEQPLVNNSQPVVIKKKINLKLIIIPSIIFVILVIVAIIAIKTFSGTSGGESTAKNEATINNLIADNDKYIISNYVNTNDMYRFKYPSEKTLNGLDANAFNISVASTMLKLGDYSDGAYYQMSDISYKKFNTSDYSNGKDLYEKFLSQLMSKYSPDVTYAKSQTIGDIEWSKFSGKIYDSLSSTSTRDGQIWVAISHGKPLVFEFINYTTEETCGSADESDSYIICKGFVDKRDDIVQYIISSIEFIDSKEVLLNTFENSATVSHYSETTALLQKYEVEDYNYLSTTSTKMLISSSYSNVYRNTDKLSIDDIYDKVKGDLAKQVYNDNLVMTAGNTYKMSNKKVGDYTVKNYTFAKESRKPYLYFYTFVIGDFYGYIGSFSSDTDEVGNLDVDNILEKNEDYLTVDSAVRNFYWSNDGWDLEDL